MAEQKVELRKVRDFSDNLNETFLFIRQNFKTLLTCFLGIAGIFMLTSAILGGIYQREFSGLFTDFLTRRNSNAVSMLGMFNLNYFLVIIFGWLNFVAMEVAVISYLKVYETKNRETPLINEVWDVFRKYFLKVFFYSIPAAMLTFIGLLFCLVPGIYLMAVFIPLSCVIIIEDQTFSGAFNRCFRLVKDNFWISLGTYLLTYFISAFSSSIISFAVLGISGLLSSFTTNKLDETTNIILSIFDILGFIFFIIYFVSVTLHYFNLAEKHDGTGMMKRLDSIGGDNPDFENIQEQY